MRATCLIVRNPLDPAGSTARVEIRRAMRIRSLAPKGQPVLANLNGRWVLRAEWRRHLRDGDHLILACLPAGGGGAGGSDPMRTILTIALMAFAGPLGATLAGGAAGNILFGSFTVGKALGLGIMLAGSAVINALMPVPAAQSLSSGIRAPSPTYSLTAQGNSARLDQPIPVQYGRILSWPDLAAQPYTEYSGSEQYLYQLLCLGHGDFDIEQIRIEDTPISAFTEIEAEIVPPGSAVTLFPTAVVTSTEVSGQELLGRADATWTQTGTVVTLTETAHGRAVGQAVQLGVLTGLLADGVYQIATVLGNNSYTVAAPAAASAGTTHARTVIGGMSGFVASAAGSVAHHLAVDLVLPYGLYGTSETGQLTAKSVIVRIEAQRVDDAGLPLGSWSVLAVETLSDRTNTPIRKSYRYLLATPGRYRVRAWRVDAKSTEPAVGDQVVLAGLRSYLRAPQDFGAVTMIAIRARATNNLSLQASRRISVIATRKLPVWNGTTWSAPVATRSIAWAIADMARNPNYGPGMADAEIDLAALLALADVWAGRGDAFDARFDQAGTWWDAVQKVARSGRAQCFLQGGKLRTVRDGPATIPVAMFSERNIKRGSFSISYLMPTSDTADAVKVTYFDAATWSNQSVTCKLSGSTAAKPSKYAPFGITAKAHAQREGTFLAAVNTYRRRIASFGTEMEGRIPILGDLITLQHAMPGWSAQAEARAWSEAPRRLTVSEPMVFAGAGVHYAALRRPDGSVFGPVSVVPGETEYQLILSAVPDFTPETGSERERTHVVFGPGESARAKVAKVTPRGLYEYDIQAVLEDPAVHVADQGLTLPAISYSQLPRYVTRPLVTGLLGRRVPDMVTKALFAWNPAPNADSYQLEMAEGDDPGAAEVTWIRVADTTATQFAAELLYLNRTMIRVRGIGLTAGPWLATTLGALIPDFWLSDGTPFWLEDSDPFWSN